MNLSRDELLQIVELTERWSSEEDHRFFLYEPNPIMYHFHISPSKTRVLLGGNRAGKSECLIEDLAMQFLGKEPKSLEGLIPKHRLDKTRRIRLNMIDYPNAFEKTLYPKIKDRIPSDSIVDVLKEQGRVKAIVNDKGGFIEFMQYEQDVKKFQGTSRHVCAYDEEPPQSIRDENLMRLIDTDGEECFSMTPIAEENTAGYMPTLWIYDHLFLKAGTVIEKIDGVINVKSNPTGDPNITVFFASIYDNIAISREAADRILSKFTKEEREARAFGKFMFLSGLIYSNYNETIHMIEPFNEWWKTNDYTLYLAIDPHPRTPHAVLYMAVRRDGIMFIVDELFESFANIKEFVDAVKAKCMGKVPELILIDPSAYINDPINGSCFAYDLIDAGLYPKPIKASKDLSRGIIQVKKLFSDTSLPIQPLYVTSNCVRFRYEILHYRWSNWTKNTGMTKEVRQKPVDKDDHMMENLYRLILANPTFVDNMIEDEPIQPLKVVRNPYTGY